MKPSPLIAIDALGIDQPGGARTAVLYLFEALFQIRPRWRYIIMLSQNEPLFAPLSHVQQIILPLRKGWLARGAIQLLMPYIVLRHGVDLVHFAKSQGGWIWKAKTVLTLFDVTTLRYPHIHSRQAVWIWRYVQPIVARHTDAIVTLSQNAAADIREMLNVAQDKITIIPCAPSFSCNKPTETDLLKIKARYQLPEHYMLFVGILALKKNLPTLIKALGALHQKGIIFPPLVLAGPRYSLSDAGEIFDLIENLGLKQHVFYIGPVENDELPFLYTGADLFLMPSVHEGFGIPCLEAMQCGTPLIVSHAPALPEIVKDAGLFVDAYTSPTAWAAQINCLLNDAALRTDLITKGYRRVKEFSWQQSASLLAELYEHLLQISCRDS